MTSSTPDPAEASGAGKLLHRSFVVQAMVIVAVALILFLPGLGSTGLSMSEGHRVVPGWEMLERGDWRVPHMFERVYLRKPPGMPWAIAASSMVFGKTELAARLVSVVATALAGVCACWFARRWYGARWGSVRGAGAGAHAGVLVAGAERRDRVAPQLLRARGIAGDA